jgi:hypothetical protein
LVGRDGDTTELIWVRMEMKYFCKSGWTGQIRLIRFKKSHSS